MAAFSIERYQPVTALSILKSADTNESALKEAEALFVESFVKAAHGFPNFAKVATEEAQFRLGKATLKKLDYAVSIPEIRARLMIDSDIPETLVDVLFSTSPQNFDDLTPADQNLCVPKPCFTALAACPLASKQIALSHDAMLNFLGLVFNEHGLVVEMNSFEKRAKFWKNELPIFRFQHQIARMLACVGSVFPERAQATIVKFSEMHRCIKYAIPASVLEYWIRCYHLRYVPTAKERLAEILQTSFAGYKFV